MQRRAFGSSPVDLSAFCFGVMRLLEAELDEAAVGDLFVRLHDAGVTSFHVSHEYPSHALACAGFRRLRRLRPDAQVEIIAKLPAPHFSEERFDPAQARTLIEDLRRDLGVGRIDLVQWMVRQTPNDDVHRLAVLARDAAAAEDCWSALKAAGLVGAVAMFAYSDAFLRASLDLPWLDGLIDYLNLTELHAAPYLDQLQEEGRGFAAIRPLASGARLLSQDRLWAALKAPPDQRVDTALRFSVQHPATACAILTATTPAHLEAALAALSKDRTDASEFHRTWAAAKAAV